MIVLTRWATISTAALRVSSRKRGAQPRVGCGIERGEAVIEEVHGGRLDERAGDRETLALASRDVRAALVDRGIEPPGHGRDEVARLCDLEGMPELGVGRVGVAESEVARNGATEQIGGLGDKAEGAPQLFELLIADVDAVHEHRARGRVEKPRDQVEERRLAAPGPADDRARLAGLEGK